MNIDILFNGVMLGIVGSIIGGGAILIAFAYMKGK